MGGVGHEQVFQMPGGPWGSSSTAPTGMQAREMQASTPSAWSPTGRCQVSLSNAQPSPALQAGGGPMTHTTAKLVTGGGTVRMAIAEPGAWDASTA